MTGGLRKRRFFTWSAIPNIASPPLPRGPRPSGRARLLGFSYWSCWLLHGRLWAIPIPAHRTDAGSNPGRRPPLMPEALASQEQERNRLKVIGGGLAFLSLELQAVRRSGPIVMQAPPLGITMEVAPWPPSGLSASLPFAVGPSSCQVDCREHFSSAFLR